VVYRIGANSQQDYFTKKSMNCSLTGSQA